LDNNISVIENLFAHHDVTLTEGTRKVYQNIIRLSGISIAITEAKKHIHSMSLLNKLQASFDRLNNTLSKANSAR